MNNIPSEILINVYIHYMYKQYHNISPSKRIEMSNFHKNGPFFHDFKVLCRPLYCVDNSSLANIVFKISFCTVHCAGLCGFFCC